MDQSEIEVDRFRQHQTMLMKYFPDLNILSYKGTTGRTEELAIYRSKGCKIAIYYFFRNGSIDYFLGPKWNTNEISWERTVLTSLDRIESGKSGKVDWINIKLLEPMRSMTRDVQLPYAESLELTVKTFAENYDGMIAEMYVLEHKAEQNYLKTLSPINRGLFVAGKMIRKAWAAL